MITPKTEAFKKMLLNNLQEYLVANVSLEDGKVSLGEIDALQLFKTCMATPIMFLLQIFETLCPNGAPRDPKEIKELEKQLYVTVKGVGSFRIAFSRPRRAAGKKSVLEDQVPLVPHFRVKMSRKITDLLVKTVYSIDVEELREQFQQENREE